MSSQFTMYYCDACKRSYKGDPISISAKEWNIDVCISPYEREYGGCDVMKCKYNLEGDMCINFYFCDKCSNSKSKIDSVFNTVRPFNW